MKERFLPALVAALLFLSPMAFAADDPATTDKPATDKPAADKPAAPTSPAPATPAPGGGRFGGGGFGGAGGFGPVRDPFAELLAALGDVNLSTDFTLAAEQKEKIQVIVTDFKKATEQWRTDHAADLKKISDDFAALRNNNGGGGRGGNNQNGGGNNNNNNRQQMQQIIQARQTLMDTQPKSDEPIAQIKGLLSTDQLKKLQAKLDERKAEADRNRQTFANGFGNRGGGNANGGNGGNNGGAANGAGGRGGRGGRGGGGGGGGGAGGAGGGRGGGGGGNAAGNGL